MKIQLKKLRPGDTFQLTAIIKQDTANSAYLEWPFNKEAAMRFITEYNTWGIWLNGSILVGAVEVKEDNETAYFVAQHYQNLGIATHAILACREYLGDAQLWACIHPDNKASLRVAEKTKLRVQFYR